MEDTDGSMSTRRETNQGINTALSPDEEEGPDSLEWFYTMPDQSGQLCARCSSIDFAKLWQMDVNGGFGDEYIAALGTINELKVALCPLCHLFASSSPSLGDGEESVFKRPLYLRISSRAGAGIHNQANFFRVSSLSSSRITRGIHGIFVAESHETGFLHIAPVTAKTQPFVVRLINPGRFDMGTARQWLHQCREHHKENCTQLDTTSIQSLWVIDCHTRQIIDAPPSCKYVALSYVWGRTPPDQNLIIERGTILPALPKTIEDSMYVTVGLGIRYIWIDRYCIEQSHQQNRMVQIQQMDLIYSAAQLTIIAAAGDDPSHGLPGINGTTRSNQGHLRCGDYLILHTLSPGSWTLQNSTWASRGWTYQEGMLSRRRLIFTSQQVFYECDCMHCPEVWAAPNAAQVLKKDFLFTYDRLGTRPLDIMYFVSEYYQRHLTYPGDALNAMRGIFEVFEKAQQTVYNLSGVLILPPLWHQTYLSDPSSIKRTGEAIEDSFIMGLFWYHKETGERRCQFPSWSWAGWQGGKLGSKLMFDFYHEEQFLDTFVWIEDFATGDLLCLPEETELPGFLSSINHYAAYIHIEAWTISCSIAFLQIPPMGVYQHESSGVYAKIAFTETITGIVEVNLTPCLDLVNTSTKTYLGILMRSTRRRSPHGYGVTKCYVLIVEDKGGYHERVGCCAVHKRSRYNILQHGGKGGGWREMDDEVLENWFDTVEKTRRRIRLG